MLINIIFSMWVLNEGGMCSSWTTVAEMNYSNPLKRPEGGKIKPHWLHASSHLLKPKFFYQC